MRRVRVDDDILKEKEGWAVVLVFNGCTFED